MQMCDVTPPREALLALLSACTDSSQPRAARQLIEVRARRCMHACPVYCKAIWEPTSGEPIKNG